MKKDALERVMHAVTEATDALAMAMDECDDSDRGHRLYIALSLRKRSIEEDFYIRLVRASVAE